MMNIQQYKQFLKCLKHFYIYINLLMSQSSIESQNKQNIPKQVKPSAESKHKQLSVILGLTLISSVFNLIIKLSGIIYRICLSLFAYVFLKQPQEPKHNDFNQRHYQKSVDSLQLNQQQLGFTNQVLYQQSSKSITLYLPVYITCKIKSVQQVSVQNLNGNISCALIINVGYGDIPDQIVKKLQNSIIVQLNRGQAMKLQDNGLSITTKNDKKSKLLIFTVRKVFHRIFSGRHPLVSLLTHLIDYFLDSQYSELKQQSKQHYEPTGYDQKKQYKISFNCMRNSDKIPISFALDCVFGVYDLAQKRLETYHSQLGSYSQIVRAHQTQRQQKLENKKQQKKLLYKKLQQSPQKKKQSAQRKQQQSKSRKKQQSAQRNKQQSKQQSKDDKSSDGIKVLTKGILYYSNTLIMRKNPKRASKPPKKVKYFQYTHFVVPLYKYPGNSLATIFIPIFLLALVSLAIFFQGPELSGRIGTIATMVLGYIALIPSIKQQLPPSSKITIIENVVYIETMCCLLCLYESFRISDIDLDQFIFIWYQNIVFMICLITHILTFLFVIGLFAFHKLKWEPGYNCEQKILQIKPADNLVSWDNPYCDKAFDKFNKQVLSSEKLQEKQKRQMEVKVYKNPFKKQQKKEEKHKSEKSKKEEQDFGKVQVFEVKNAQNIKYKSPSEILVTDFPNVDEFAYQPNLQNYESTKKNTPRDKIE